MASLNVMDCLSVHRREEATKRRLEPRLAKPGQSLPNPPVHSSTSLDLLILNSSLRPARSWLSRVRRVPCRPPTDHRPSEPSEATRSRRQRSGKLPVSTLGIAEAKIGTTPLTSQGTVKPHLWPTATPQSLRLPCLLLEQREPNGAQSSTLRPQATQDFVVPQSRHAAIPSLVPCQGNPSRALFGNGYDGVAIPAVPIS